MTAELELKSLMPFLVFGVVLFVIVRAIFKGQKVLRENWPTDWPKDDVSSQKDVVVIRRYERPSAPPPLPNWSAPEVPAPRMTWEQELERVLRGETEPSVLMPPPLPPITSPPASPPPPPPSVRWSQRPPLAKDAAVEETAEIESAPAPAAPLAAFASSASAHQQAEASYQRGASIEQRVLERFRQVDQLAATAPAKSTRKRVTAGAEAKAVRTWLQQPDTARAALVAAVVYGPPKALQD